MLEPRVEGVGADAGRGSGTGCGFLAVCKAAGRQLEGHNRQLEQRAGYYGHSFAREDFQPTPDDTVDGLLSSS
jgi:hypothetical protein